MSGALDDSVGQVGGLDADEKRLLELRAERARIKEAREQRDADSAVKRQIEEEERALRDELAVSEAEEKHGAIDKQIKAVYTSLGVVIVKRPNAVAFRRFQDAKKITTDRAEELVRPCVVHPTKDVFDRYCAEQPAIIIRCANAVSQLAGVRTSEVVGK